MRRVTFLAPLALLLCHLPMQAQISVYVTSSNLHLTNAYSGTASGAGTTQDLTSTYWAHGVGGGVTLPILPLHFVSLGLDLRGSTKPGTNGADTALGGIRLSIHPPLIKVKPYIQGSAGYLATRTADASTIASGPSPILVAHSSGQTISHSFLAYGVIGGIDFPLIPFLDLRLEAGFLRGNDLGSVATGSPALPNPNVLMLNPGLVVHF